MILPATNHHRGRTTLERPKAWIDALPFAPHFRRSRLALLLLRTLCLLHVRQSVLESFASREVIRG